MGLISTRFFRNRDVRILMLGLDCAGKTSILYRLKLGEFVETSPTIGFNVETVVYKNVSFVTWDVGSRDKIRPLFRHYYKGTDALIIVIDSADEERLQELMYDILQPAMVAVELQHVPVLFIANKQDLDGAMSIDDIIVKLDLMKLMQNRTWSIIPACARSGKGLTDGFEWLGETLGRIEASKSSDEPVNEAVYFIREEKIQTGYRYVTDSFRAVAQWICGRRPTIVHV